MITTIAFDADDTLWHNERIFLSTKDKFTALLSGFHDKIYIERHLDATETKNIKHFGYGVKGFTLSMIETACELTEGRITGDKIKDIIAFAKDMLASPIEVLDGVEDTIKSLSAEYRLICITKGDLLDQETKLARSGLGEYFDALEIVPRKVPETYENILKRHDLSKNEFVMVGNSLRSDILPVIEIGAKAVFIPYESEWFHEAVSAEELQGKIFTTLENIGKLRDWIQTQ
ncbi:MAG: HAD hydrolase-like protein [Pyrinomonadaceae bacterium]|nr:HAD hydrolase-like protein [Pyrinomonadaceae bacterium]